MRATKYFRNSEDMAKHAKEWRSASPYRWYLRTTLRCDHVHHERRKAIVLVEREKLERKLITCSVCNRHGNSLESDKLLEIITLASSQNKSNLKNTKS